MAVTPIVLAINASGLPVARRVAEALECPLHGRMDRTDGCDVSFENALDHVRDLFAAGHPVIGVCAAGILIRAVASLLGDKRTEPPVVSVADDGSVVVPLLGGHRGANRLAREIGDLLGAHAAVTTAGDLALGVALDDPPPGWALERADDAKAVMAGLLAGDPYVLIGRAPWLAGLESLPNVAVDDAQAGLGSAGQVVLVPNRAGGPAFDEPHLVFHQQLFAVGVGCARNAPADEIEDTVQRTLMQAGVSPHAVASINTIDLKLDEPGLNALAVWMERPLRAFAAAELAGISVPNPSAVVESEVGTPSVSEAAALAGAGGGTLIVEKRKTANTTCALARAALPIVDPRGRRRGQVSIVSIGPGQAAWRTPEASRLVADAEELVGYGLYIDLLGPLAASKPRKDFPLGGEEDRCRYALERAATGCNVALVCSGDAGIYAMGALVFELMARRDESAVSDAARRVNVVCTPGVSALQAAAARAGAPLGHDFCAISLSDLLTPRADILRRVTAAAEGDFVIAFYNPVSKRRRDLLPLAREILLQHRPTETPVLLATSLGRPDEHLRFRTLGALDADEIDMMTVVLVGSSNSRLLETGDGPRMFTPRGYARKMAGGDLA